MVPAHTVEWTQPVNIHTWSSRHTDRQTDGHRHTQIQTYLSTASNTLLMAGITGSVTSWNWSYGFLQLMSVHVSWALCNTGYLEEK